MADPYRISQEPPSKPTHDELLRPALWLALIVSAAANAASSSIGLHPLVGIGFGLVTVACAATLTIHHYRHRRR